MVGKFRLPKRRVGFLKNAAISLVSTIFAIIAAKLIVLLLGNGIRYFFDTLIVDSLNINE
jgi:hypothetical protein